jgi:hypothetical protein
MSPRAAATEGPTGLEGVPGGAHVVVASEVGTGFTNHRPPVEGVVVDSHTDEENSNAECSGWCLVLSVCAIVAFVVLATVAAVLLVVLG